METETRSWGFEHTFQEFGSIRVNILGIWIDSGTPAPKMKSRSKIHAKFAVFSLFFCVFHPQNPQNFRLRRPDPQKSLNPQDFFQNASKSPALRNTPPPHPPLWRFGFKNFWYPEPYDLRLAQECRCVSQSLAYSTTSKSVRAATSVRAKS